MSTGIDRRDAIAWTLGMGITLAIGLPFVLAAPASADPAVGAAGWWTDRAAAMPLEGGAIEVAAASDGTSVAALVLTNDIELETAELVLSETGTPPAPTAGIELCVLPGDGSGIAGANGAPLGQAPATACADGRALSRNPDRTWSVDVVDLLGTSPTVAVALIPIASPFTDSPLGGFDPGWVAQFGEFAVAATSPEGADPVTTTTTAPATTTTTAPSSGSVPATVPPSTTASPPPTAIVPRPVPPAPLTPPTTTPPPVEPIDVPVDETAAEQLSPPSLTVGPIEGGDGSDTAAKLVKSILLLPLGAGVGLASVYGRRFLDERG